MIYPRYNRQQSLVCKLSDEDIIYIKSHYTKGVVGYGVLAKHFSVKKTTIRYWVDSSFKAKRLNYSIEWMKNNFSLKQWRESYKKVQHRKYRILYDKMLVYNRDKHLKFMEKKKNK